MHTKMHATIWIALSLAAPVAPASAATYQYTLIQIPGASATSARGLNDSGMVFGDYEAATGHHCFSYNGGTITVIDPPGSTFCEGLGISADGTMVGTFQVNGQRRNDGFTYKDGVFTTYGHNGYETQIFAVSPNGTAIGSSTNDTTKLSRIFEVQNGIEKNEAVATYAQQNFDAVNDAGTAVGDYVSTKPGSGYSRGLIDRAGRLANTGVPNGERVVVIDINAGGTFVGAYTDKNTGIQSGFVNQRGVITSVTDPNRPTSGVDGINDLGDIVIDGGATGTLAGEALVVHSGLTTVLQPPNVPTFSSVAAGAINSSGQVLGGYFNAQDVFVSFLAEPLK